MFRRVWDANSTVELEKASCHDEPHRRFRPSLNCRERHKHIAIKCSKIFAHRRVAERFRDASGITVHFSFKHKGFAGYMRYLMTPGKKASTDLDLNPATYPPNLDAKKEAEAVPQGSSSTTKSKSRTRLTFDDVSNIIMEGVGSGPIRTVKALESAAASMKRDGNVELWNYLGAMKSSNDVRALVMKVWRMLGDLSHPMFKTAVAYPLSAFDYSNLPNVAEWASTLHASHALILSGLGGKGKTQLAKALMLYVCPQGFWFLDDPDDFRELGDSLDERQGLVVDEVCLATLGCNQVKKMFDLEETRRINCRYLNATIPARSPRIFVTNSSEQDFYPKMTARDATGVKRRQLFVEVTRDVRRRTGSGTFVRARYPKGPYRQNPQETR